MPAPVSIAIYIILFILGICIGSFLNVLIWRIPNGISFIKGRSFCPKCNTQLKDRDLIPVFSFLFLKGRCRACKEPISARYPIIETLTGLLFMLSYWRFGLSFGTLIAIFTASVLICITMIDFDTMEIPDGFIIALILPAVASVFVFPEVTILARIIGAAAVSLPMLILALLITDAFGGADIKLMAVCGFMLGWQGILLAMFIGILLGGGYGIYLLATKKAKKKESMPFGPYLCVGIFVSLLYGSNIISAYINYFFG